MAILLIGNHNNKRKYNNFKSIIRNPMLNDIELQSMYRFKRTHIESIIQICGRHLHRLQNGKGAMPVEQQVKINNYFK